MAMGSSNAHSKTRRPGNSRVATSQADTVPMLDTSRPTIRHSQSELAMVSGNIVAARCARVSPVPGASRLAPTASTGRATRSATKKLTAVSGRNTMTRL